jgi:hypothetical protein
MARQILLTGLAESGKTTFLAAMWYLIRNCPDADVLKVGTSVRDEKYLNAICENWTSYKPQVRTTQLEVKNLEVPFADLGAGESSILEVPDLSGEIYRDMWDLRQVPKKLLQLLGGCEGILFFVNPKKVTENPPIALAGAGEGGDIPWNAKTSEYQVKVVQVLQDILEATEGRGKLKLAFVVSAWDIVSSECSDPEQWIEKRMPFLFQFLENNTEGLELKIYGVSAQGNAMTSEADIELLTQFEPHYLRCKVACKGEEGSYNLTRPIKWLFGMS